MDSSGIMASSDTTIAVTTGVRKLGFFDMPRELRDMVYDELVCEIPGEKCTARHKQLTSSADKCTVCTELRCFRSRGLKVTVTTLPTNARLVNR